MPERFKLRPFCLLNEKSRSPARTLGPGQAIPWRSATAILHGNACLKANRAADADAAYAPALREMVRRRSGNKLPVARSKARRLLRRCDGYEEKRADEKEKLLRASVPCHSYSPRFSAGTFHDCVLPSARLSATRCSLELVTPFSVSCTIP